MDLETLTEQQKIKLAAVVLAKYATILAPMSPVPAGMLVFITPNIPVEVIQWIAFTLGTSGLFRLDPPVAASAEVTPNTILYWLGSGEPPIPEPKTYV